MQSIVDIGRIRPYRYKHIVSHSAHKFNPIFAFFPQNYARVVLSGKTFVPNSFPVDEPEAQQLGYIYAVPGLIAERCVFKAADKPVDRDLATKILFYIHDHFHGGIPPGPIAQHFGYNRRYLSRYFKNCCGIPPVQYLTAVQLKNAILLMREGKHNITYRATESGFSSMQTFYRVFREEFSRSPRAYLQEAATKKDLLF